MAEVLKRDEVTDILRHLHECRILLKKKNIYSCLLLFREVLKKALNTKMLAQDERALMREVNAFQNELADAKAYRDMFGPAAFQENDMKTTINFLDMLIAVKDEEINSESERIYESQILDKNGEDKAMLARARQVKDALDQGEQGTARELVNNDERVADLVFNMCNSAGIMFRKTGRPDRAILEYRKALVICPDDEGIYYNIARAYVEMKDWRAAREAVGEALKINPEFPEGKKLYGYIASMDKDR